MKKIATLAMLAGAVLLAVMFASTMAPADGDDDDDDGGKSRRKSKGSREATVLKARASLPSNGTDVVCTFKSKKDVILASLYTDNTPTTIGNLLDFELVSITIDGSAFLAGQMPVTIGALNDRAEIRDMYRILGFPVMVPVRANKKFIMTYMTRNGNDVEVDVYLGVIGADDAKLKCKEN